jgi:hypothetical protein
MLAESLVDALAEQQGLGATSSADLAVAKADWRRRFDVGARRSAAGF